MVHRDVKPSNLFLVGGSLHTVKLLDFGIALRGIGETFGRSQGAIGTPGYVAPEQAQGARGVDARADVFALGAVLFECLTGEPAFIAGNVIAVLAKILLEDAPRPRELAPEVPPGLDALVARLLAKDPALRPRDGAAVLAELRALPPGDDAPPPAPGATAITAGEQRLLSVILATTARAPPPAPPGDGWDEPAPPVDDWAGTRAITARDKAPGEEEPAPPRDALRDAPTAGWDAEPEDRLHAELRAITEEHGGGFEPLADGSLVVTLKGIGAATDQAARAARCALALRRTLPSVPMALATGRGMVALRFPVGEAIDLAARHLRAVLDEGLAPAPRGGVRPIRLDETTAGLLDARFEVGGDRRGLDLLGERPDVDPARTLLGKKTPFVGRERELGFLAGLYDECVAEPLARPVLVTAPPGAGKSRLAQELRDRLARHGRPPEVWTARGDPSRAGSPFGMLAPALRRAAGILDGEALEVRHKKLRARIARHVAPDELPRIAAFIGELLGARWTGEESLQLRAARRDPVLMGDQMRRAFEDWVAAEAGGGPLLVVLEDLQWGDLPTVKFIEAALRHAHDRPILALALARPEVHALFPRLWSERGVQELRLGELTSRSSEKLVRQVLGAAVDDRTVAGVVSRAAGNALYLEELCRAVAEKRRELPATVLAMMAARLEELEPEARRILRAASVFGQAFWRGGVGALLGGAERELGDWLRVLVERETIRSVKERRFPGEEEYVFRHALMRDAAYALMTESDRALGHSLAAEWLERAGEEDASALAEHLAAGPPGGRARAAGLYLRAARQALEGNDLAGAVAAVDKGLALGVEDADRAELLLTLAEAKNWLGDFAEAEDAAAAILPAAPRAGRTWLRAVGQLAVACMRRGNAARLTPYIDELAALAAAERVAPGAVPADALDAFVENAARAANHLILSGRRDLGAALLSAVQALAPAPGGSERDPAAAATLYAARAAEALYAGDPEGCHALSQAAAERYLAAGSLRHACVHKSNAAFACIEAGALAEAEAVLRELLPLALRLGTPNNVASAQHNLGYVLAQRGALDEAVALEREAIATLERQGDRRLLGSAEVYLAVALAARGDLDEAAAAAARAVTALEVVPPLRAHALAVHADIQLRAGRPLEARALAERALAVLDELGSLEEGESLVRLVDALTLEATGRAAEARAAAAAARARVEERAEAIRGAWRQSFLQVRENARTLELAARWGV
jgi:tetratricopeptide (TPR) repeat protein